MTIPDNSDRPGARIPCETRNVFGFSVAVSSVEEMSAALAERALEAEAPFLVAAADVVVAWGCSLTMWTTRHGRLLGPEVNLAQVDDDDAAIGALPDTFSVGTSSPHRIPDAKDLGPPAVAPAAPVSAGVDSNEPGSAGKSTQS